MKSHRLLNIVALLALVLSIVAFPAAGRPVAAQEDGLAKVEALVLEQIAADGTGDFIVWLAEKADLTPAGALPTKAEKGRFVFDALRATADRTQAGLRSTLDAQGLAYTPYYIVNAVLVRGGSQAQLADIAARPEVASIAANHHYQIDLPKKTHAGNDPQAVEANLTFIKADQVWAMGITGQGTVVAGNDTGLDETHPAIAPHYRGCLNPPACTDWDHNYNWWDATGLYPTNPDDGNGHGTHTTGTMVGDDGAGNQIGVAPGAQTIHCKNMDNGGGGSDATFITCFQFDLAPWDLSGANADPSKAPDAVNNSWGYWGGGDNVFRDAIDALLAAGIVVEVSAGNEGPGCQTLRSPADYAEVFTTGSVNHAAEYPGTLTGFSSRGLSALDEGYFPDFMAPGEEIRSSFPGNSYGYLSGTSMSGPHVTALIGLIWSANPALRGQVETTYNLIRDTAARLAGQPGSNCGGDYVNGPNNDWGYGTIDAYQAVLLAMAMGASGTLQGTVTDAVSGLPVAGAAVKATHDQGFAWNDITDANGFFQMTVAAGTFSITAKHPHYMTGTASGIVVVEDGTTVQDFALTPRGWAYGIVTDFDNGTPIEGASVAAEDGSSATTGAGGVYELWLDPGAHTLTASAENYAPESAGVAILSGQGTLQDFSLQAAVVFIPSPVNVTVPMGSTHTQPATLLNRQPWDYAFQLRERAGGFIPALLGPGVQVKVAAGPQAAPAGTAVAEAYQPRPAGSVAIQPRAGVTQANVLLLNADDDNGGYSPIRDLLLAYGDLGAVDLFDARYSMPTLDQLLAYEVVVTWSNYLYYDNYSLGNLLADYVDAGGKVINALFALDPIWGLSGRFVLDGYTAMAAAGYNYALSCLGAYDPAHPIMDGVTDVCDMFRAYGTALTAGSYEVARWQDGELFVAAKDDQTVVSIAGYPGINYQWSGQFADVLHNAILFLAAPADVPWLAEDPTAGSVPADGSLPLSLLFDASPAAGVTQPGLYWADVVVDGDPKVTARVNMTVEPPPTWGKLEGTVTGLGYCDADPGPLEEAAVVVTGSSGQTWNLVTDAAGHYVVWVDEAESPLTVSVTYPQHQDGQATGVVVVGGQTTVQDFSLRWLVPCMSADPLSMAVTLDLGASATLPLTLSNQGAAAGTFEASDLEKGYAPMKQGFLPAFQGTIDRTGDRPSIARAPNAPALLPGGLSRALAQLAGEPAFAVDVYPGYNLVTFPSDSPANWTVVAPLPGNTYFAGDFIGGDFSTLYVIDYDTNSLYAVDTATGTASLIGPSIPFGGESWTGMSGAVDGTMYASSTSISRSTLYTVDLGTGAVTVVGEITNAPAIIDIAIAPDGSMYGVDIVNDTLVAIDPATGAGSVIGSLGFNANYAQGMDFEETSGTLYLAAYSTQGELRIADPATGNTTLVGAFPGGAEVDSLAFATGGGGDAPWLSENPPSGSVPPDGGTQTVDVTFDAGMVTQPGTYLGEVKVKTNDPVNKTFTVTASMTVNAPANWGRLEGIVTGLGRCEADPGPLSGATVLIQGAPPVETDAAGYYTLWLAEGTYTVNVEADGHLTGAATVTVVGQQTTVQDFGLRLVAPCVSATPPALEVTLLQGSSQTLSLWLTNLGAGDATFKIREQAEGLELAGQAPAGASTKVAPEGYKPVLTQGQSKGRWPLGGTVAVFKDADPWGSVATETFLAANGIAYEVHGSAEFGTLDFEQFGMIVFSGDQPTSFYDAYASYVAKFEDYVDAGGFLNFFSCDSGWNGGVLTAPLPGGMSWTGWVYDNYNVVDDPAHPVVQGVPNPFYGDYASHGHFGNLPADAHVIASEQSGGQPTIVEYPIGDGWLIAFGQPLEISYDWGWDAGLVFGNALLWGFGFEPAVDIPWLSEDPVEGTLPHDSTVEVAVTFAAAPDMPVGTYSGTLIVKTGDAGLPRIDVPVTLHVTDLEPLYIDRMKAMWHTAMTGGYRVTSLVRIYSGPRLPVEGAIVFAEWTLPDGQVVPQQGVIPTNSLGITKFRIKYPLPGEYQVCVTDIVLDGYLYNPGANWDGPCETVIVP